MALALLSFHLRLLTRRIRKYVVIQVPELASLLPSDANLDKEEAWIVHHASQVAIASVHTLLASKC
jgi:hypothetical protein